jgi:hypothetical protein
MAALIAWMLVVRVDDLVKDGAISAVTRVFDALWRRRLRRSSILDKIINANRCRPCDQGRFLGRGTHFLLVLYGVGRFSTPSKKADDIPLPHVVTSRVASTQSE